MCDTIFHIGRGRHRHASDVTILELDCRSHIDNESNRGMTSTRGNLFSRSSVAKNYIEYQTKLLIKPAKILRTLEVTIKSPSCAELTLSFRTKTSPPANALLLSTQTTLSSTYTRQSQQPGQVSLTNISDEPLPKLTLKRIISGKRIWYYTSEPP